MPAVKIAVTIDEKTLLRLDQLVKEKHFPNRSRAVEEAIRDKLQRMKSTRLARECAKLVIEEEKALAEEGMGDATQWPEY